MKTQNPTTFKTRMEVSQNLQADGWKVVCYIGIAGTPVYEKNGTRVIPVRAGSKWTVQETA